MSRQTCITVDLDSTLCDTRHRREWLPSDKRDSVAWAAYASTCGFDEPLEAAVKLIRSMFVPFHVISDRHGSAKEETVRWLRQQRLHYTSLRLSPTGVPTKDFRHKRLSILQLRDEGWDVVFHVDDDVTVVSALAEIGVPVLLVRPSYVSEFDKCGECGQPSKQRECV